MALQANGPSDQKQEAPFLTRSSEQMDQVGLNGSGRNVPPRQNDSNNRSTNGRKAGSAELCSLFRDLSQGDRHRIISTARTRHFAGRDFIFVQGDPIRQVYLLIDGHAKISQVGANGDEIILRLMSSGNLLGSDGLGLRQHHASSAQALRDCTTLVWEAATFAALLDRFPIFRRNERNIHGELLLDMEDRFRVRCTEDVPQRLSREIVHLARQIGERVNGDLMFNLSQGELAQLTGTTLFTVSRLFSKWSRQGLISSRRNTVFVHKPEALVEAACSPAGAV